MGASAPALVIDPVEHFERDREVLLSPEYKEEQLRCLTLAGFGHSSKPKDPDMPTDLDESGSVTHCDCPQIGSSRLRSNSMSTD